MSDFILLKDKTKCPNCSRHSIGHDHCWNCGMRLFKGPINFAAFEADGNDRRYWLWTNDNGWIYRDHVINGLQPLSAQVDLSTPPPNVKPAAERAAEARRDARRKINRLVRLS